MMTIEQMKERKAELMYTYGMIAEKSGLPLSTVQKVLCGVSKKPRRATMEALDMALKMPERYSLREDTYGGQRVAEEMTEYETVPDIRRVRVSREDFWAVPKSTDKWPHQGEYTAAYIRSLPEDIRVELIDGYIYDMASPSGTHQFFQMELASGFRKCIEDHGKRCIVLTAPFDRDLGDDDRTVVQPDVMIMCARNNEADSRGSEVPDLVAEILSDSTRIKDSTIKLNKYFLAGVREYWIIDPKKERVVVYFFEEDMLPTQYSFGDIVPVGISAGECEVDFAKISARLEDARRWGIPGLDL